MAHLVHSTLLSGMLSGRGSMHSAVTRALHVAIKEKAALAHYLKLIDSTGVTYSKPGHPLQTQTHDAHGILQTRSGQVA